MKKLLGIVGFSLVLASVATVALAQNRTFTNQYSFGDSLTDSGNAFAASGGLSPGGPPYFNGRWSNGPTFAELLGNTLALGGTAAPSVKSSMNFAFGGATAVPANSTVPFPSLPAQLALFQSHAITLARTDLVTLWIGANDIINTVQLPTTPFNPSVMDTVGAAAAQAAAGAVQSLITLGAKNIVVLNLPDIGTTPGLATTAGAAFATRGSLAYDTEFDARLAPIAAAATDVNIVRIDARALFARIIQDYKALGYTTVATPYTSALQAGGVTAAGDPNSYVFFDPIHPSEKTHELLAAVVTEALNPEPVVGFAATEGTAALALESLADRAFDARLSELASTPRATGRADAYASFNQASGDRAADGFRPEFSYDAQVVTAGVDARLCDGFFLGGALDTGRLNADIAAGGGNFTMEDQSGRLYGVWRGGPVAFAFDADYGVVELNGVHRTTAFGGFQTTGKASGTHWGAGLIASWNADLGGVHLRPWLGIRTERVRLGAYTEQDVPTLSMDFDAQNAKSSAGTAGVALGSETKLGARAVHFDFSAAWHGEVSNHTRGVSGQLADNFTRPTIVSTTDGDGRGFEFTAAGTLSLAKNLSATLGYAGDVRSNDRFASRFVFSLQTGF